MFSDLAFGDDSGLLFARAANGSNWAVSCSGNFFWRRVPIHFGFVPFFHEWRRYGKIGAVFFLVLPFPAEQVVVVPALRHCDLFVPCKVRRPGIDAFFGMGRHSD